MSVGVAITLGAVLGLALGIVVSVTTGAMDANPRCWVLSSRPGSAQ
jgi:hypothetical protein